jgi:hypothetical protein
MDKAQTLNTVRQWAYGFTAILLLSTIYPNMVVASELNIYPEAELVASEENLNSANRRIILGPLKKIKNILEPKSYNNVRGELSSATYYIPDERRVDQVAKFYENQMNAVTQMLFSCQGRNCGSSNYWAGDIFQLPILYGPEQYQSYYIGLTTDKTRYIAVYVAQRGTRKIYVHVQVVRISENDDGLDNLFGQLSNTGRVVIPLKNSDHDIEPVVSELGSLLDREEKLHITLVVHDILKTGEMIEDSKQRTLELAELVKSRLIEAGISQDRLDAYGLGPLAPAESGDQFRLEVLVLQ